MNLLSLKLGIVSVYLHDLYGASMNELHYYVNSGVQHPVARVSIRFINVTTVRNYFYFFYFFFVLYCIVL
jgi:hypothetical protein